MNVITLLLGTYWTQTTFILLGLVYFIKRFFDNKAKKMEIDYTLFRQNKLNSIIAFLDSYSLTQTMWLNLNYLDAISGKINSKELDEIVWTPLEEMKKATIALKIYYDTNEHVVFEELTSKLIGINQILSSAHFEYLLNSKLDINERGKEFISNRNIELKLANEMLIKIARSIRVDFEKK